MPVDAPQISVVVPVYNSAPTLAELVTRLRETLEPIAHNAWEVVLVNDGSRDGSWDTLRELAAADARLVAVDLARNFGQHNALMAGLAHSRGQLVVTIDDDLQVPPEEIATLTGALTDALDVVYGEYRSKSHAPWRNLGSTLIQAVFRRVFGVRQRITAFRLLRRSVVDGVLRYRQSFTFLDGLIAWHTCRLGGVPVDHQPRKSGASGYSLTKLVTLAFNLLTNFSTLPLHLATLMGFVFSAAGFGLGTTVVILKLVRGVAVTGWTSLIAAVTLFAGVQLLTLGILGEYIGRLHLNSNRRPQYAVRCVLGRSPGGGDEGNPRDP